MAKAQTKTVDEIWKKRAPDLPIKSPGEMVTLASIVEKETGKADERPRVAGVFVNRLQKHMRLESDPTIVYGLVLGKGTLGHSITKADLNQSTPYNTYIIDGLPPGPICNPGKAALEAVANPARGKDLYFVADGTGGHVFAETLDQHQKNVAHWRQIEKDAKDKLAPDVTPQPAPAIRGSIDPVDPAQFGALVAAGAGAIGAAGGCRPTRRIGADRNAMDAALASLASLQASSRSRKWARVVAGVNDAPAEGLAFDDAGSAGPAADRPIASAPVPPAMLADQKAREAKYGTAPLAPSGVAVAGRHDDRSASFSAAAHGFRPAAHLRRVRRHPARSAAQQDLRPELRQGRARRAISEDRRRRAEPRASGLGGQSLAHERKRDRAGVRDVEAPDRAGQVEAAETIAPLARQASQALVLRAEDQRQRARERFVGEPGGRLRVEPDPPIAHVAHFGERAGQIGHAANRHVLEPARGGLRQRPGEFGRMALGGDQRVDREGGRGAQDRADIVRIGDLVEDEHETVRAAARRRRSARAAAPRAATLDEPPRAARGRRFPRGS